MLPLNLCVREKTTDYLDDFKVQKKVNSTSDLCRNSSQVKERFKTNYVPSYSKKNYYIDWNENRSSKRRLIAREKDILAPMLSTKATSEFDINCKRSIRLRKFTCNYSGCDKSYIYKQDLTRHENNIHINPKRFQCALCESRFSYKHHLNEHSRIHSGEKPLNCRICNKAFSHSGNLSNHLKICLQKASSAQGT